MSGVLLNAIKISKRFGGVTAVDDVSLTISDLEVKSIIGANGAGKSTLFNILCGSLSSDSGTVIFNDENVSKLPQHYFSRLGIAIKFQIPSVFNSMTVRENLSVALREQQSKQGQHEQVDETLSIIKQQDLGDQLAGNLSHGQKQWLEIGMALMSKPKLLLLDEPTAGMTIAETQETAALIHELSRRTAVMAIEHDMSFVRSLNCHTYVMHQGKIIKEGMFEDLENDQLVRNIYLGKA